MKLVRFWDRLPRDVVDAPTLAVLKARLDKALRTCSSGRCPCPWQGGALRSIPTP